MAGNDTTQATGRPIQIGDYIKARGMLVFGWVEREGSIPFGKRRIAGYIVRTPQGKIDVIMKDDAVLIAPCEYSERETPADDPECYCYACGEAVTGDYCEVEVDLGGPAWVPLCHSCEALLDAA